MIVELGDIYNELDLERACLEARPLNDFSRLVPALKLSRKYKQQFGLDIAGTYGLLYILTLQGKLFPAAQAGFDLTDDELVIANSPQGFTEDRLSRYPTQGRNAVLQELKRETFRDRLLDVIVSLARRCSPIGVRGIRGISAENHPNVTLNGGTLALDSAVQSMDLLYQRHGFSQTEEGDYSLKLVA